MQSSKFAQSWNKGRNMHREIQNFDPFDQAPTHRELNPSLFGSQPPQSRPVAREPVVRKNETERRVPYAALEIKSLEEKLTSVRSGVGQMEKRTEMLAGKMEELAQTVHVRLERVAQNMARVEEAHAHAQSENAHRLASVIAKVNERKVSDSKIQDMLDRHNTIVRGFENRLTNLQRLVTEQEMTLHSAQAALEDARNEIARLKRL
jgi:DNA repair exonuclease SbcCD ATPase subunit